MKSNETTALSLEPEQTQFIKSQSQCILCDNELEIHVESYSEIDLIKEEAHCPFCNIKARIKDHKLQ